MVSVSGELDLYVEDELREALDAADLLAVQIVIVDLSGAAFMDSTALGVLVGAAKRRRRDDGELILVSNAHRTNRVLEIAGLDKVLHVYPTLYEALQEHMLEAVR